MKVSFLGSYRLLILGLAVSFSVSAFVPAAHAAPPCMANGQVLDVNNASVLNWKATTQDQYHNRAHILGLLTQNYADQTGHKHMQVKIGPGPTDSVEVIYNLDFGQVANGQIGSQIEACGDYITARNASGGYPPSPDGAIVHWVHNSPRPDRHDSGYLMIDGQEFGSNSN